MSLIKKNGIRAVRYALLRSMTRCSILLTRILSRPAGLKLFGMLGDLVFAVPHADRQRTIDHLRLIFGNEWDEQTIRKNARNVYHELGKNLFDMFLLPHLSLQSLNRIVSYDSLESLRQEYAKGKGCIIITAHTGCFQMPLHFMGSQGFRVVAIGKKMSDNELDRIIRSTRSGEGIRYMDRSESPRKIVRYLQEGRIFGVLIDQDTSVEGVFADFLGLPAYTPSGPVKMAMKLSIPLFVLTSARQNDDTHHIFLEGPLPLRSGDDNFPDDLQYNVNMVNGLICRTIRRYPTQWVWMHRRWRRKLSPLKDALQ